MNAKELFHDALPIIQKFAPSIGGAIGGPFGFATGYIIPILASAFNSNPNDIKTLVANIVNDPSAQQKLEQVECDHGDWLCTVGQSVDKLSKADIHISLEWK